MYRRIDTFALLFLSSYAFRLIFASFVCVCVCLCVLAGKLGINGRLVSGHNIRKISAYIQQQDVFLPNLTVYEHLYVQVQ